MFSFSQGLSEDPLAQSQGSVSPQCRERGSPLPNQCSRVTTLIRPSHTAPGGLFQVHKVSHSVHPLIFMYCQKGKVHVLVCLPLCRFSVNVFQPPFQSGRTSPETSQSRVELPSVPGGSPEGHGSGDEATGNSNTVDAGDLELGRRCQLPESQSESAQASALHSGASDSLSSSHTSLSTTQTADSGFSESISATSCCSLDPHAEKETTCEKAVRPEGDNKTHSRVSIIA